MSSAGWGRGQVSKDGRAEQGDPSTERLATWKCPALPLSSVSV